MILTSEIHDLQMAALEATRACPKCDGLCEEMRNPPDASQGRPNGMPCRCLAFSDGCDGSGRILILDLSGEDGLRVECSCRKIKGRCFCEGRGWTPNDDFWAWLDALEDLNSDEVPVRIDSLMYNVLGYQEPKLAFYTAVLEAVTARAQKGE